MRAVSDDASPIVVQHPVRPRRPVPVRAIAVAAVAALAAASWAWARIDQDRSPLAAEPPPSTQRQPSHLPSAEILDASGHRLSLDGLAGGPLVVNLWFSTCVPCRTEMPGFQRVADAMGSKVSVVGLNPVDDAATMASFVAEVGARYAQYRDLDAAAITALGVATFPATVFVRSDHSIAKIHYGALSADELTSLIRRELGVR